MIHNPNRSRLFLPCVLGLLLQATLWGQSDDRLVHVADAANQDDPALSIGADGLFCIWSVGFGRPAFRKVDFTSSSDSLAPFHSSPVPLLLDCSNANRREDRVVGSDECIYSNRYGYLQHAGTGVSWTRTRQCCRKEYQPTQRTILPYRSFIEGFALFRPSDTGWTRFYSAISTSTDGWEHGATPIYEGKVFGYDPDTREYLVGLGRQDAGNPHGTENILDWTIAWISYEGKESRKWGGVSGEISRNDVVVPIDSTAFLVARDTIVLLYAKQGATRTSITPRAGSKFFAVNGDRFVRLYRPDSGSSGVVLEVYRRNQTMDGSLSFEAEMMGGTVPQIVQREGNESIVLLWATPEDGVHVMVVDRHLTPVVEDRRLSRWDGKTADAQGVVRNDTLFAVWEDYRTGNADIRGRAFPLPTVAGVQESNEGVSDTANAKLTVVSEPMQWRVSFTPTGSSATLHLHDYLGRSIESQAIPSGTREIILSTEKLPVGVYILRYEWEGKSINQSLLLR